MLSRFKIGTRLALAFGLVSLFLLGTLVAGVVGITVTKDTAQKTLDTDVALASNAAEIQRLALLARRFEKDVFIKVNSPERAEDQQSWAATIEAIRAVFQEGEEISSQDSLDSLYLQAESALQGYEEGFMQVYRQIEGGSLSDAAQANQVFSEHKESIYRLAELADEISLVADSNVEIANEAINAEYRLALWQLCIFAGVALLIAVALAIAITRSIVLPLRRAVEVAQRVAEGDLRHDIVATGRDETAQLLTSMAEMSKALTTLVASLRDSSESVLNGANEIAQGGQELAARTEQQAAALQETASSMEEMTATVRQNSDSTKEADTLAHNASQQMQSGGQEVSRSVELMREVAAASLSMNKIVEAIDAIAFQTNILALNASVEAARAGDKGRGFAVVATEVRALASRSAASAGEIRTMLDDTRSKIKLCSDQAERGAATIGETEAVIQRLAMLMVEVSSATREQSSGIEQINTAITEMDSTTQQNSTLVQQSTNAAFSLEDQAGRLRELVAAFQIDEAIVQKASKYKPAMALPSTARQAEF
ncbi:MULTISPECIES: methyl-accepting chemotaxis protein [unclassified Halomonas]|uniref:methyl-accepting chemotaxis protein n=1 Tax=unclassified Halomonas TaxID=2609666 RepID=UPI0007D98549|nr:MULTISPECIES: methyl-accepting chemotaxis protein [unclassified Halomonas]MBT2788936.1 HAMP domain-containing protein [Halomonas sp. ISL-106]MBT2799135.1 HAMP domain-containing protein [Halomonas sp. ISL-104]OAL60228.1 chemotaxis protein [Halomonas sp. ALS9]